MRRIFIFVLLLQAFPSLAQTYSLSGTVVDKETSESLIGVNVLALSAADTNKRSGTVSDLDGNFTLAGLEPGPYIVRINYVGYDRISRTFTVGSSNTNLGTIQMQAGANTLDAVVIEAAAIQAQQRGDTIEFNARSFKTNPDASTEDLVQKMPGISNDNGTIKANGEEVKRVLVDGKPFYGDDPAAALKNLPADVVDKIQILDQQSDQARFTGFDDGNQVKTINIITRPGRNQGYFGRVQAGYGTDDRYIGTGSVNYFNGARRISLLGLSNNINQQNFSSEDFLGATSGGNNSGGGGGRGGRGGGSRGGGMQPPGGSGSGGGNNFLVGNQSGINTTNAIGLNYTDEWGPKIKVTGSYFFNTTANNYETNLQRNYLSTDSGLIYQEASINRSTNTNHRANLRLEYTIDSNNELIFVPRVSFQDFKTDRNLNGASGFGETSPQSIIRTLYTAHTYGYNINSDLTYRHRFAKRGRTVSIGLSGGANSRDGDGTNYSLNEYINQDTTLLNQRYDQNNDGQNISGNLSYTEPIGKRGQLLVTYQPSYTRNNAERLTYDRRQDGSDSAVNNALTNVYENRYLANRGGIGYRFSDSNFDFNATANVQTASLDGDQTRPYPFTVDKKFFNFLPQVNFNYKFSRTENLRFFYRTSANTPSITQLQNVVDNSNPLLLRTGNPDLRQDYTHSLNVRYGRTNPSSGRGFFLFANASLINDYIGNYTYTALTDTVVEGVTLPRGSQLTRPINIDGAWNARSFANFSQPIKAIKTNLNLNAGVVINHLPGYINGDLNVADNYGFSGGTVLSSNISENIDFTVGFNGTYTLVNNSLEGREDYNYYNQSAFARLNYIFLDRFVLATDLTNTLYTGLGQGFNQNYTLWNASLGYKFLKDKSLQVDLYAFDLLKQNNSISRTITDSYIEDAQTNVLQRFFMLRLSWRIRKYAGTTAAAEDTDGRQRRNEGGPGRGMGGPPPPGL
jgi:hypothetical protein